MERIVKIKGNVTYPITLDPSVWILDDRKKKLEDFFKEDFEDTDELEAYTKAISKQWDKEMLEGNTTPQPKSRSKSNSKKFLKEELLTETYGIYFHYFLKNSQPLESAKTIVVVSSTGERSFPIKEALSFVLCFSDKGKALTQDGPIHVYYGGNADEKITSVQSFIVI